MKAFISTLFSCFIFLNTYSQLEFTTGYAINKNLADGAPIHLGYNLKLKGPWFTKPQIGFKYLYHYNTFVGASIKVIIWEFHQTLSYEVIKKKNYVFMPNVGLNYRFYKWKAEMTPPFNEEPLRAWRIGTRSGDFVVESTSTGYLKKYAPHNLGFSIHLQNQFRLNKNIWVHITPFLEPDYDRFQNTGGCYIGIVLPSLSR